MYKVGLVERRGFEPRPAGVNPTLDPNRAPRNRLPENPVIALVVAFADGVFTFLIIIIVIPIGSGNKIMHKYAFKLTVA